MITTEALADLDFAQFNGGVNPHGDDSINSPIYPGRRRSKLRASGMVGHHRVLDLLCGFGGWTIFLSELNEEVHGLDKNKGAINIALGLSAHFGQTNVHYKFGDVSQTADYADEFFDAVWMWNALIYVERGPTLTELRRILKPGGRLTIGLANSTGRLLEKYAQGIFTRNPALRNAARQAFNCFRRGPHFEGCPNYFTKRTAGVIMQRHGFTLENMIVESTAIWNCFPRNLTFSAVRN